ncbi:hypothetical protein [Proteus mirabilis]|uniref:hypothetical protein n=1 Tax=Proteus mirabilis TaxID=584 RepID=UPI0034D66C27
MNIINKYCLFLLSVVEMLLLSGCHSLISKIDTTFLPPENGRTVKISVDVPDIAELSPIEIMYRSNICLSNKGNGNKEKYVVAGHNYYIDTLKKESKNSIYSIELPILGGGKCDWQLSNVTLRLTLKKNNSFTKDIVDIVGTGVIIIFDNNQPQRSGGRAINKKGDFDIVSDYFPWINRSFKNSNDISLWLYGKALFLYYQSRDAQQITWKPIIHSDIVVYSEYPAEEKTEGVSTIYSYPDGTKSANRNGKPDYNKLLSLIKPSS